MVAVTCLQQLRIHTEELTRRGPVVGAGPLRGRGIIADLGLEGSSLDDDQIHRVFLDTFGIDGTRLRIVMKVASDGDGGYEVESVEGACTHLQQTAEPMCAYPLGVFIGATSHHRRGDAGHRDPVRGRGLPLVHVSHPPAPGAALSR
jgi:hypothetical protein